MEPNKLYDSQANQRVTLAMLVGGEVYEPTFKFRPLSDDQAVAFIDTVEDADSATLFLSLLDGVTGIELDDDEAFDLAELANLIPAEDKRYVVDGALMGTRFLPAPKAAKKLNLRQKPEHNLYRLAVYFDGAEIITEHKMNYGSAEHDKVFRQLEARQFPVRFGDREIKSYGWGLVWLYDALQCSATGYAGAIPAHHKMVVAAAHLRGQRQIVMGK